MDDLSLDDLDNLSDISEGVIQITPAEVVDLMVEAWVNEKFAPEILPNKSEIVDIIVQQIATMEDNIKELSNSDFKKSIYSLEIDRLRFLIASYLRTRLEKIEAYVNHILKEEAERIARGEDQYLTVQETRFAKEFSNTFEEYFDKLLHFYPGVPSETWSNQLIQPNKNSFVFLKSKKMIQGVSVDESNADSDVVDFKPGSQSLIPYSSIIELLKKGDVHLI